MRRHHGRAPSPYAGRTPTPPSAEVTLIRSFDHQLNPSRPARQSPLAASQFQGMPLDLIERIRSFPLFQTAPDSFLLEMSLLLKPQMHSPNDYIITEGDDAKAMYWIVRGAVSVTSRDGESTYAELKPGSFVGEIGILMDKPRTASVIARARCLTLQLKKEDLRKLLPRYPEVEQAIREEALERLAILEKKKKQVQSSAPDVSLSHRRGSKRTREISRDEMEVDAGDGANGASKRRKSPSPSIMDIPSTSVLGHGLVNVRTLLKELPLFANLPPESLHFLGLNAQPRAFGPFADIIKQDSTGREVFFIVRGEVEVLDERHESGGKLDNLARQNGLSQPPTVKARLRAGQYFGEVVSLALTDRRTATVRSVTQVECLIIPEEVLSEFWERCTPSVRQQIEATAKERLRSASENDVIMKDADSTPDINDLAIGEGMKKKLQQPAAPPRVTFNDGDAARVAQPTQMDDPLPLEPSDPDPFQSVGLDKVRARSRRGSLAPLPPDEPTSRTQKHQRRSPRGSPKSSPRDSPSSSFTSPRGSPVNTPSPIQEQGMKAFPFADPFTTSVRPRAEPRASFSHNKGSIPDQILPLVLQYLELHELMRLQGVSMHWRNILTKSPVLFKTLDLSKYNRRVTDEVLVHRIGPFVGARPRTIDLGNCFHITDEGFAALADMCGTNVVIWKMKSVWDVTAAAILEMSNKAKGLVEVDLSNCRKVSDTLLARMVGWVVPQATHHPNSHHVGINRQHSVNNKRPTLKPKLTTSDNNLSSPPPGTVVGCHSLSHITLSYCKHITDRTMHHLATHASERLAFLDLTRCTTITDTGFGYWGQTNVKFHRLRTLILADCTYLTDQAIIYLVNAAGSALRKLDLSFCCALSDTSTEVIALSCPNLEDLSMSFCGSAVSDASLRSIGNHLTNLRALAVRGCVRVTGIGVDAVVEGCCKLEHFDVSQCKNIQAWVDAGGVGRWHKRGRRVRFEMVK